MRLRIAIVVHGRFHAFDLARELIRRGTEVILLTNYPRSQVERYGIPGENIRSCVAHGLIARAVRALQGAPQPGLHRDLPMDLPLPLRRGEGRGEGSRRVVYPTAPSVSPRPGRDLFEPTLHRWFSRWAASTLRGQDLDALHCFSGVAEEVFGAFGQARPLRSLVRGSAHIRLQARILTEERRRCGRSLAQPSQWMIQRELREYRLASLVIVLSSFAKRSFLAEGFPAGNLRVLPLGSDLRCFRASPSVIQARCRRIQAGDPLRVLTVGSFTYQKGMLDLAAVARTLSHRFKFRFVGDCPPETRELRMTCRDHLEFVPRQAQALLARQYEDSDLFLFPTLQDGYAAVLAQAHASALPILTTTNSAGADLISNGETGWVLPIRAPARIIERLRWCDENRHALATMVGRAALDFKLRDWSDVAADFGQIYQDALNPRPSPL